MAQCKSENCTRAAYARSLCGPHYRELVDSGGVKSTRVRPLEERFWEKVDVRGDDECWPWLAGCIPGGYGTFTLPRGRGSRLATHVVLALAGRPVERGKVAMHVCDNPNCVNPHHLEVATQRDNVRDWPRRAVTLVGRRFVSIR
jgi:hypothetical protein